MVVRFRLLPSPSISLSRQLLTAFHRGEQQSIRARRFSIAVIPLLLQMLPARTPSSYAAKRWRIGQLCYNLLDFLLLLLLLLILLIVLLRLRLTKLAGSISEFQRIVTHAGTFSPFPLSSFSKALCARIPSSYAAKRWRTGQPCWNSPNTLAPLVLKGALSQGSIIECCEEVDNTSLV